MRQLGAASRGVCDLLPQQFQNLNVLEHGSHCISLPFITCRWTCSTPHALSIKRFPQQAEGDPSWRIHCPYARVPVGTCSTLCPFLIDCSPYPVDETLLTENHPSFGVSSGVTSFGDSTSFLATQRHTKMKREASETLNCRSSSLPLQRLAIPSDFVYFPS